MEGGRPPQDSMGGPEEASLSERYGWVSISPPERRGDRGFLSDKVPLKVAHSQVAPLKISANLQFAIAKLKKGGIIWGEILQCLPRRRSELRKL